MDITPFHSTVTAGTHNITIPSKPGKDVLVLAHSPAIMTKPSADWVEIESVVVDTHSAVWQLPAAKNGSGITTVSIGLSVPYTMVAVVLQDYGIETEYAVIAQRDPSGDLWGTGAHTFSAQRAIAFFGAGSDSVVSGDVEDALPGTIIADSGSSTNADGNGNVRLWLVQNDDYDVVADGVVIDMDPTLAGLIAPNRCNSGFIGFTYDPDGGGTVASLTVNDTIFKELTDSGYTTGSILDRERKRLLAKLTLTEPQNLSLQDLYFKASERPRLP